MPCILWLSCLLAVPSGSGAPPIIFSIMPPVQANKDYQLWVLDKDKSKGPVSAGVIRLDDKGYATLTFKPVEPVTPSKFAISVEKQGGVPQKSADGPVIFVGVP